MEFGSSGKVANIYFMFHSLSGGGGSSFWKGQNLQEEKEGLNP